MSRLPLWPPPPRPPPPPPGPGAKLREAADAYFRARSRLEEAFRRRDYAGAATRVREGLERLVAWLRAFRAAGRPFEVRRIPALERGGTALVLVGDLEGLAEMRRVVESEPELAPWAERVREHELAARLVPRIETLVRERPVCLQSELKALLGVDDARLLGRLVPNLVNAGRIARIRRGRAWRLLPPDSPELAPPPESSARRPVRSHRADDRPPPLRESDLSAVRRIALPPAVAPWEHSFEELISTPLPETKDDFEVRDASWRLRGIERLPAAERPDPEFRRFHPSRSGLFLTTDQRRRPRYGGNETGAVRYDRSGGVAARKTLPHGSCRFYCPPFGRALVTVSRSGIVRAYDEDLRTILETPLEEAPEVKAWRSDLPEGRTDPEVFAPTIAISADAGRYLFGLDDRAWCVARDGRGLWGIRFPKAGWVTAEDYYGEDEEPPDLGPPPPPDERHLPQKREILKWPDGLSLDEFIAKFGGGGAGESDPPLPEERTIPESEVWMPRFIREVSRQEATLPFGEFSIRKIEAGDAGPAHPILDVAFSSSDDTAFLATRDGLVVAVDGDGEPLRVYEGFAGGDRPPNRREPPGSIPPPVDLSWTPREPRRIVHHDDHLYLMTLGQVYVLHGDTLLVVLDLGREEDLYCTRNGFFLHEPKRVRAFRKDGGFLGSVLSKDPIRRLYQAGTDTVIETRTRRAAITGIPVW